MSENKITIIKEKVELPKFRLWAIWLLLFVFPSLVSIFSFNYIKGEYKYFADNDLIYKGFDEINKYNDLIAPENYIEQQQNIIKNLNINISLEQLKKEIDNIILGESCYCFFFDEEVNNIKTIKSKNEKSIPPAIFKKHLKPFIKNLITYNKDNSKEEEFQKYQINLANFIQTIFKTATPVSLLPNKTSKNFSVVYGGELYFIFTKFEKTNNDVSYCLSVLKGRNISINKMIKNLHKKYPEISIVFRDYPISKTTNSKSPLTYCGIKQNKDELYILAPTDFKFARHVLFNGTTELDKKFDNLFPFIKYKIPTEKIVKYLKNIEIKINCISLIAIIISSIYFLYISLFNFSAGLKFKQKILILTLITNIFPFTILSLGIYTFEKYNRFIIETTIKQQTEFELYFASKELDHYVNEIIRKLIEFGEKLSNNLEDPNYKPSHLLDNLNSISESIPISKIRLHLDPIPPNLEIITSDNKIDKSFQNRLSKKSKTENNDIDVSVEDILTPLQEDFPTEREEKNYITIANRKVVSHDLGDTLTNIGTMKEINKFTEKQWIHTEFLKSKKTNKIIGVLLTKFEPKPILYFFLKNSSLTKKGFKEIKENYEISYAFIPIEKSGTASIWNGSGYISEDDKKICLKSPQSKEYHINDKTIITKYNQNVPHLAVAMIKDLNRYNDYEFITKILLSITFYLSLILLFSNKLLDYIFVKPVMLLASNANKIAKGSEEWDTEIRSGDEFEELNKKFKHLVAGLRERNILKSYVSEDAFSDIEESSDTNLKPGGEYMEATIVFSAIKDYDKLSLSIRPEESIKILSKFMSIAEEVTKKYNGSIDKIIGDTIMLVFRNNTSLPSHGLRAAQASLELVEKAKEAELPNLYTGIASGRVISGKIGSYSGKLDFTVIGNPVNSAARFKAESKNGTEQTGIIISGATIRLTKGKAKVKFLRRVAIKGKSRMYNIYELIGCRV